MEFYKVYYTDMPLIGTTEPDLSLILPLEVPTYEDALNEAFKLIYSGAIVWRIDGPNGFRMKRNEIEEKYHAVPHAA